MLADYIEAVIIAAALSSTPAATTPSISAAIEEVEPLLSSQVAELIGLHIKGKNSDYFTTKDGLAELEAIISRHFAALALSRSIPASGARLTDEPCARCGGTGETQGYGDNNVPCGLCAGTGKRVDFVFPDTSPRATSSISAAIAEVERLRDEIDAKLAEGKGTWPESDYVRDQVWHSWGGQQYAYNKALEALRALQPSTPTTSAIEAAKELVPFLNPYFQLNRDWQERVAAIITKHCGGVK